MVFWTIPYGPGPEIGAIDQDSRPENLVQAGNVSPWGVENDENRHF